MADRGFIIVWLDQNKDRDAAYSAAAQKFPEFQITFLNPRYFEDPFTLGVDPRKVRGHILATDSERVHRAYTAAGVEFIDMREIPNKARNLPPCVVVYTKEQDNEWNDAMRAIARVTFPAIALRPKALEAYSGIEEGNVVGVICPQGAARVAQDYGRAHRQVIQVPHPGGLPEGKRPEDGAANVDIDVLCATLKLPVSNLRSVVQMQTNLAWLRALADTEAADDQRVDVQEIINDRMAALGSENPHFSPLDMIAQPQARQEQTEPEVAEEPVADGDPAPEERAEPVAVEEPALTKQDTSYIGDMSVKQATGVVASVTDVDLLTTMRNGETAGKRRSSILTIIDRRIRALSGA